MWSFRQAPEGGRAGRKRGFLARQWLGGSAGSPEYPKIKALARKEKAGIYFGGAVPIRSDHHAVRPWGKRGDTPIIQATGARYGISLIPAIPPRGKMRFMIIEKGSVNADVFIEILKRLFAGAKRAIFLIFDRGSAYRATKAGAFVQPLGGKLRLFFLPPSSPDRNPDKLELKHLKADTTGRVAASGRQDVANKVRRSMRNLQNDARKIISYLQKPSLKYAARI